MAGLLKYMVFITILMIMLTGCNPQSQENNGTESDGSEPTTYRGEYLGQTLPGRTPQQFLPQLIDTEVHSTTVFSPDGNEVFWTPMDGSGRLRYMEQVDGVWYGPETAVFGGSNDAGEPFFSADGNRLYFISRRAPTIQGILQKENIWYVERGTDGWSEPVILGETVNGIDLHWGFSLADNGNLYYAGHTIGEDIPNDIYMALYENGEYTLRDRLGEPISTEAYTEDTPFVAPDESYLLFARVGPGSNYADMYICLKNPDGSWGDPVSMNNINTGGHELWPWVTRDGRFLFFMSTRGGGSKPWWVSAEVIEDYR